MTVRARSFVPALASLVLLAACAGNAPKSEAPASGAATPVAEGTIQLTATSAPKADAAPVDKEALKKELDKKTFELECKRSEARIERLGNESATRGAKNEVDSAEFERTQAQKELENFQKVLKPNELAEGQLDIDRSQQRLKEQQQELDELKALYKSSDFADLTKEMVVGRHESAVAFAQRAFDLSKKSFVNKNEFELVQKEAGLAQRLLKAEHGLQEAKARQDKEKQEIELKDKKTLHEIDELEADVKKLGDKLKSATTPEVKEEPKKEEPKKDAPKKEGKPS